MAVSADGSGTAQEPARLSECATGLAWRRAAFAVCNLLLGLGIVAAFGGWRDREAPARQVAAAFPTVTAAPAQGPGPSIYLVSTPGQAAALQAGFSTMAFISNPMPPYRVLVVTSDAEAGQVRQALAWVNQRRARRGLPLIRLVDLRTHYPASPSPMPSPAVPETGSD